MNTITLLLALLVTTSPSPADACHMTIPELIERRRPEPVEIYVTGELVPVPFDQVLADSQLIVEGRVHPLKTYLGDDKCYLYTDFEIVAPLVVVGALPPQKAPAPQPSLVVKQRGGALVIDGVKVIVEYQELPPFRDGQRVMLLLSRLPDGRYEITGDAFGAFVAEVDGTIRPVLRVKGIYDDMQTLTRAAFVERVKRAKVH